MNRLDIDEMGLKELKDMLKILLRVMNHEGDRITALQDRVLSLEIEFNDSKKEGIE